MKPRMFGCAGQPHDDVAYQLMDAVGEECAFLLPAVIPPGDIGERVQL